MLILAVSAALVAGSGLLVAARLAEGGVTQWLVATYVIAFAEIVVVSLLLSLPDALTRWNLLAAVAGVFCLVLAVVRRVPVPPLAAAARAFVDALRDPVVAALVVIVLGVVGYSLALGLFTPPNTQDELEYHLARAAFWRQEHAVGFIHGAQDVRLGGFPPNGEIAMAFTMVESGTGRYAPLVQLLAALAVSVRVTPSSPGCSSSRFPSSRCRLAPVSTTSSSPRSPQRPRSSSCAPPRRTSHSQRCRPDCSSVRS